MVHDKLASFRRYDIPWREDILNFLDNCDPLALSGEEIEIKGRDLFVRPSSYETRSAAEGRFETHRLYADLQHVVQGTEIMQTAPAENLSPLTDHDAGADCRFFRAEKGISSLMVHGGEFVVFWPGEAHRPCCTPYDKPVQVRKLVFKIRIG